MPPELEKLERLVAEAVNLLDSYAGSPLRTRQALESVVREAHEAGKLSRTSHSTNFACPCFGCGHPDCGTYCCQHDEFAPHPVDA